MTMLYFEKYPNLFTLWTGEPINDIRYPLSISSWSPEDLAAIGLYNPEPADEVPEGKIVTGQSVQRVEGIVKWVYTLDDSPEVLPYIPNEISRRQFYEGLAKYDFITKEEALAALKTGALPTAIQTIIDSIEDENAAFEAEMHLIGSLNFNRNHPLVPVFASSQEMSEQDVLDFWLFCSTLE